METKQVTAHEFYSSLIADDHAGEADESPRFNALLSQARKEARREGRMEGLKEMDDRWLEVDSCLPETFEPLYKLRQEYKK